MGSAVRRCDSACLGRDDVRAMQRQHREWWPRSDVCCVGSEDDRTTDLTLETGSWQEVLNGVVSSVDGGGLWSKLGLGSRCQG